MPDMSHTPGPWKAERRGDPIDYDEDDEEGISWSSAVDISGPDGKTWQKFASVYTFVMGAPCEEGEANLALILAAPDLLAACKTALMACELYDNGTAAIAETMLHLQAAIAKAEGGRG